ncbi:MAG: hypothetical protein N0C84_05915 [Candidatus Thiodiazotropha taylori]|nr:hypothetical protein [Candidatus Thiodiazotropha taylori]
MDEQEFIEMLIENGWATDEAVEEAYKQYHGDEGDCDGDLAEFEV